MGEPENHILEVCMLDELNHKEIMWMEIFDSIDNGLNIIEGGITNGKDTTHGSSKYTKDMLRSTAEMLAHPVMSLKAIKGLTGISIPVLSSIASEKAHVWLFDGNEDLLFRVRQARVIRQSRPRRISSIAGKTLKCPQGTVYRIGESVVAFARQHGLKDTRISGLFSGKIKTHRGWSLP